MSEEHASKKSVFGDHFKQTNVPAVPIPPKGLATAFGQLNAKPPTDVFMRDAFKSVTPDDAKPIETVAEAMERAKEEHLREIRTAMSGNKTHLFVQTPKKDVAAPLPSQETPSNWLGIFLQHLGRWRTSWISFWVCMAIACAVGGVSIYQVQEYHYKGLIATMQVTIDQWRNAPAPLGDHEWAPLSPDQISDWVASLEDTDIKTITVYWGQEVQAQRFFFSLQEVGKRLKINVHAAGGNANAPEIEILAPESERAGHIINGLFKKLLTGTGYPVRFVPYQMPKTGGPVGEVSLFIGEKL